MLGVFVCAPIDKVDLYGILNLEITKLLNSYGGAYYGHAGQEKFSDYTAFDYS